MSAVQVAAPALGGTLQHGLWADVIEDGWTIVATTESAVESDPPIILTTIDTTSVTRFAVCVGKSTTLSELKDRIAYRTTIPPSSQQLKQQWFGLVDNPLHVNMHTLGYRSGVTQIFVQDTRRMRVHLKASPEHIMEMWLPPSLMARRLEFLVSRWVKVSIQAFGLRVGNRTLAGPARLSDYGITHGFTIAFIPRQRGGNGTGVVES